MRSIKDKALKNKKGFTILELLVFSAIFSLVAIVFVSILVSITRVHVREGASIEVNQQSQFLLQTIQRYIESASLIEMEPGVATSTLAFRLSSSTDTPENFAITYIYLDSDDNRVYLKEGESGEPKPLSSDKVSIDDLTFTKGTNPPARDFVDISLSVSYNSQNVQKKFTQDLKTAISRASAATFDSDIVPTTSSQLNLGLSGQRWDSVNGVIRFGLSPNIVYFTSDVDSVGVGGTPDSNYRLDVDGDVRVVGHLTLTGNVSSTGEGQFEVRNDQGLRLWPEGSQPTCGNATQGTLWFTPAGGGADGHLEICVSLSGGSYEWQTITTTST